MTQDEYDRASAFAAHYELPWHAEGLSAEREAWAACWAAARKPCLHQIAEPAQQPQALHIADRLDDNADLDAAEGGNLEVCKLERDAAALLRAQHARIEELEAERDQYAGWLAGCRDAFPAPEVNTTADELLMMAIADPGDVLAYVKHRAAPASQAVEPEASDTSLRNAAQAAYELLSAGVGIPDDRYHVVTELAAALAAPAPAPQAAQAAVPVLFVSREQLENHEDHLESGAGRYLPARKTPQGKFTTPLYAHPAEGVPELEVTACYFPKAGEAELTWNRLGEGGKRFGMTVKVTPEQGEALANVVYPCITWLASTPAQAVGAPGLRYAAEFFSAKGYYPSPAQAFDAGMLAATPAAPAVDPIQAAADAASVGHLAHLLDHQSALLARSMAAMKAMEQTASPIDESNGDLDARIPYEAWAAFVDARATLLHDVAQSPVAAPESVPVVLPEPDAAIKEVMELVDEFENLVESAAQNCAKDMDDDAEREYAESRDVRASIETKLRALLAQASAADAAPAADATKYRVLDDSDVIQAEDEFLQDDSTWKKDPGGIWVGSKWADPIRPTRRPIAARAAQGGA